MRQAPVATSPARRVGRRRSLRLDLGGGPARPDDADVVEVWAAAARETVRSFRLNEVMSDLGKTNLIRVSAR